MSPTSYLATLRQSRQSSTFSLFQENSLSAWKLNLSSEQLHEIASFHYDCRSTPTESSSSSPSPRSPWVQSQKQISKFRHVLGASRAQAFSYRFAARQSKRMASSSIIGAFHHVKHMKSDEDDSNASFSEIDEGKRLFVSTLSHDDTSFDRTFLEKPQASGLPRTTNDSGDAEIRRRLADFQDIYDGPYIGDDTPAQIPILISRLHSRLPGLGLFQKLQSISNPTHQKITDVLASNGQLTEHILNVLRTAKVERLDLASSMNDEGGLNLNGRNALRVFDRPNGFLFLTELCLSGTPLHDTDLVHIQRLPTLKKLFLESTGIGNEAVFLLVSLKNHLTHLYLAFNPKLNDDIVPILELFSGLSFLSLFGTGIEMPGLRRLAFVIHKENHVVDIEIPAVCEEYIDGLQSKYMINIRAPLIVDPTTCSQLTDTALARNIAAHAECNPAIITTGTRTEKMERLVKVLETRQVDLVVRYMLLGEQEAA